MQYPIWNIRPGLSILTCAALLILLVAMPASALQQVLIDSDCATLSPVVPVDNSATNQHISGVLPGGWNDDDSWQKPISIQYSAAVDHGREVLRMTGTNGPVQIFSNLPSEPGTPIYHVSWSQRSRVDTSLTMGIRVLPAPYPMLWQHTAAGTPEWHSFDFTFRAPVETRPIALYAILNEPGEADIKDIKLSLYDDAGHTDYLRTLPQEPEPKTLLRNTRLPLGLPPGWSINRESDDATETVVSNNKMVIGPSGYPALHVHESDNSWIYPSPFAIPNRLEGHVASLYVQGNFQGFLIVQADGHELARTAATVTLTEGWQRIEVPFQPSLLKARYVLRIEAHGNYFIDALQVEAGGKATPYNASRIAEMAHALPKSDASDARIQFADEPDRIAYTVTGAPSGSAIHAQVSNLYGDTRELPPVTLTHAGVLNGIFDVPTSGPFLWGFSPAGVG